MRPAAETAARAERLKHSLTRRTPKVDKPYSSSERVTSCATFFPLLLLPAWLSPALAQDKEAEKLSVPWRRKSGADAVQVVAAIEFKAIGTGGRKKFKGVSKAIAPAPDEGQQTRLKMNAPWLEGVGLQRQAGEAGNRRRRCTVH
jgi:hypothetical protein